MSNLFSLPRQSPITPSGSIYPGAKAHFYRTGTNTAKLTYSDAGLTTPNANPVVADSGGVFPPIFLDTSSGEYRLTLKTASNVVVYTQDNVGNAVDEQEITGLLEGLGASGVGQFIFPRTAAEIAAGVTPTSYAFPAGDCRRFGVSPLLSAAANAAAFNSALAVGGMVYLEGADARGTYSVDDNLDVISNTTLRIGAGVIIQGAAGKAWLDTGIIDINGRDNVVIDLRGTIDGNKANNASGRAFGIRVQSSTDVLIQGGGSVINCPGLNAAGTNGGDGVYIAGAGTQRVTVRDLLLDANVRQGLSVARGLDIKLINLRCTNTTGTFPGCGIDIEADATGLGHVKRVLIDGCTFESNYGGLQLADCEEVTVVNIIDRNSRWNNMIIIRCSDFRIHGKIIVGSPTVAQTATVYVEDSEDGIFDLEVVGSFGANEPNNSIRFVQGCRRMTVVNPKIRNTKGSAIGIGGSAMTEDNTDISIHGGNFYNCTSPAQNAPVIFIDSNSGGTSDSRRISITDNHIYDDRTAGDEATFGIQVNSNVTSAVLADYRFSGNTIIGPTARSTRAHWAAANYNPPNLADGTGVTTTLTIPGAVVGDGVRGSFAADLQGMSVSYYISATDTMSARFQNETGAPLDLGSAALEGELVKLGH